MNKNHKGIPGRLLVISLLLLIPWGGIAGVASGEEREIPATALTHSLDAYIAYALKHNPRIRSVRDAVEVKRRGADLAGSLPDPMVMAEAGVNKGFSMKGAGISQMIMWPGMLLAEKRAGKKLALAEEQRLAQAMAQVEMEIRGTYAVLYSIGRTIQSQKENLELLRQLESVARARYISSGVGQSAAPMPNAPVSKSAGASSMGGSGMSMNQGNRAPSAPAASMSSMQGSGSMGSAATGQSALLKIQVELALLEDGIRNAESRARAEQQKLRSLLSVDRSVSIPDPVELPELALRSPDGEVLRLVEENSPQVLAMERSTDAASEMVKGAYQGLFPDITIGADYMFGGSDLGGSDMGGTSMDATEGGLDFNLSLSVPLWTGKKRNQIRQAKKMRSSMENETIDMKNMVVADAQQRLEEMHDATRRIELYRDVLVPQARQVVEVTQAGYRSGQSSFLDIIDAQRTLLDLQITTANEQARREISAAGVYQLLGAAAAKLRDEAGQGSGPSGSGEMEARQ